MFWVIGFLARQWWVAWNGEKRGETRLWWRTTSVYGDRFLAVLIELRSKFFSWRWLVALRVFCCRWCFTNWETNKARFWFQICFNVHPFLGKWSNLTTLPETNIVLEKWFLGDDPFLLGKPVFRCYTSFRECNMICFKQVGTTELEIYGGKFHLHISKFYSSPTCDVGRDEPWRRVTGENPIASYVEWVFEGSGSRRAHRSLLNVARLSVVCW